MAETFHLSVLTPQRSVLEAEVVSIIAPGSAGYLGVLAHHAPLVTALIPGKLTVKDASGEETIYAISGGFLEVSDNRATVLADALEAAADIDVERARRSRDRSRRRLQERGPEVDVARAERALRRAENRLKVAAAAA
jgi:F-type H+-transporting ATPase subunit epsilon